MDAVARETQTGRMCAPFTVRRHMNRKHGTWLVLSVVPMLLLCTAGCSGQKTEDAQVMDEAPPPE